MRHYPNTPKGNEPGVGVCGMRAVLVAERRCPIVAERQTNASGAYTFNRVPAGRYQLFVIPLRGWSISNEWLGLMNPSPSTIHLSVGESEELRFEVRHEPGPIVALPKEPTSCTTTDGSAPAGAQTRLPRRTRPTATAWPEPAQACSSPD